MSGVKLKVCGMRSPDNIRGLCAVAPAYMGMIFWPGSTRYLSTAVVRQQEPFQRVGVFVDAPIDDIRATIAQHQLDLLQLHGNETPESCLQLKSFRPVIKAFSVGPSFDFDQLHAYEQACDYFLFDTKGPLPGGNGQGFDWTLLQGYPSKKPFFLSGGIGPNAIDAIRELLKSDLPLHAIDVNSKFETAPAEKDLLLLQSFKNACDAL